MILTDFVVLCAVATLLRTQPLRAKPEDAFVQTKDIEELRAHVDYFSVMSYDFSHASQPGPSAPIEWWMLSQSVLFGKEQRDNGQSQQILGGINLFGNDFGPGGQGGPIICEEVLKLLKSKKPKIQLHSQAQENYFDYKDTQGRSHRVWFPSLIYLQSRIEKASILLNIGLAFWELGQGMDYFYDLL